MYKRRNFEYDPLICNGKEGKKRVNDRRSSEREKGSPQIKNPLSTRRGLIRTKLRNTKVLDKS